MTTEEKKRYLRRYLDTRRRMDRLQQQIADLRLQQVSPKGRMDGMPRTAAGSDLSGYAARLDALMLQLVEAGRLSVALRAETKAAINRCASYQSRKILRRRYLLGQSWDEIALALGVSYRWVVLRHGQALGELRF